MRHTGPLPPYVRRTNIAGWPDRITTPAMLALAERVQIKRLWQAIARDALIAVSQANSYDMPPLGTLKPRHINRLIFVDYIRGIPCQRRHTLTATLRFSAAARSAVSGRGRRQAESWSEDLDATARAVPMPPEIAQPIWILMADTLITMIARGDSATLRGFATIKAKRRAASQYRDWRTGQIRPMRASTLPQADISPLAMAWLSAGVIPPAVE
jgi:nucleoid DNA-binding protein